MTMPAESAATVRGRRYPADPEWFCDFRTFPVQGLGPEVGVHRRDPSSVLTVDGRYHVWYTRSTGETDGFGTGDPMAKVFPWDWSEIWHATSDDGATWVEQGVPSAGASQAATTTGACSPRRSWSTKAGSTSSTR